MDVRAPDAYDRRSFPRCNYQVTDFRSDRFATEFCESSDSLIFWCFFRISSQIFEAKTRNQRPAVPVATWPATVWQPQEMTKLWAPAVAQMVRLDRSLPDGGDPLTAGVRQAGGYDAGRFPSSQPLSCINCGGFQPPTASHQPPLMEAHDSRDFARKIKKSCSVTAALKSSR
jgi:hypothetical protein